MPSTINISSVFVLDQEEALAFYVGKLGLEVGADFDLGFMRWLTVRVPNETGREILLEVPGPPAHDPATAEQIRELVTKGAMGFTAGFTVADVRAEHARLTALGVDFTDPPTERFYGIDCGLRDPFGNNLRMVQPATVPADLPAPGDFTPPDPV